MNFSASGMQFKKLVESCKLVAYPDPGSKDGKPWTIGYGHTGPEVAEGLSWTQEKADQVLIDDSAIRARRVARLVTVSIHQGQFDALVDFEFNTGALASSTLLKKVNAKDYAGARAEFARWIYNDGKAMLGLRRRALGRQLLWDGVPGAEAYRRAWSEVK